VPDAEGGGGEDQRAFEHVLHTGHAAAHSQWVVRAHQQHHRLQGGSAKLNVRVRRRVVRQANVRTVFSDFVEHIHHRQDIQRDFQFGVLLAERREHVVHQHIDIPFTDHHAHMALLQALDRLQLVFEFLLL